MPADADRRWQHHVTEAMKSAVYRNYGAVKRAKVCCEGDHLIPRDLGGADDIANLWPQPWRQARMKDQVEVWLNKKKVCPGLMSLEEAQRRIAENWMNLYREMIADRNR